MAGQDLHSEDNPREHSLDELAKGLANGSISRGRAIKLMGAALLGGALASIPGVAFAQNNQRCGPAGICSPPKICERGRGRPRCVCPAGASTCGNNCCVAGQGCCGGSCIDVLTDPNNCGQCGVVCQGGTTCQNGGCACLSGQTLCGGVCRDLLTDVANCGACDNRCGPQESCIEGECVSLCPGGECACPGQLCTTNEFCQTVCGSSFTCQNIDPELGFGRCI